MLGLSNATRPGRPPVRRREIVVPLQLRTPHGPRMSRQISADAGQSNASKEAERETLRQQWATALDCLAGIAAHHGVDLPVEHLRHAYPLDNASISTTLLLRMAKEAGLRAQSTR